MAELDLSSSEPPPFPLEGASKSLWEYSYNLPVMLQIYEFMAQQPSIGAIQRVMTEFKITAEASTEKWHSQICGTASDRGNNNQKKKSGFNWYVLLPLLPVDLEPVCTACHGRGKHDPSNVDGSVTEEVEDDSAPEESCTFRASSCKLRLILAATNLLLMISTLLAAR